MQQIKSFYFHVRLLCVISKSDYLIHLEKGGETTLILLISYLQTNPLTAQLVTLFTQFVKSASNNHNNYLFFFILILKKKVGKQVI